MLSQRRNSPLIFTVFLYRLLPALLLFVISRLCLYLFNPQIFGAFSFREFIGLTYYGLRFDLAALFMVNWLILLLYFIPLKIKYSHPYRFATNLLFVVMNTLALMANLADVIYFRFTMKRTTGDIFDFVATSGKEIISLIPDFISDFWWVFIIWILFIASLVIVVKKKKVLIEKPFQNSLRFYLTNSLSVILISAIAIIAIRGGFQLKPMGLINAGKYVEVNQIPLVLNTPFAIFNTINKDGLKDVHYFEDDKLNKIFSPVHLSKADNQQIQIEGTKTKLNVVIIILESFSAEYIGALNKNIQGENYEGYTPFLDSLINQSLVYNGYANAQQSREGIPAILSSIPALTNKPYINSVYIGNEINSLPSELKKQNYHSAFFHGGLNGTMDFDAFAEIAGFDEYHGKDEYGDSDGFDGRWGIADEEFFQYSAGIINSFDEPFMATIFTLSSHHPYIIPEKYDNRFEEGTLKIHRSIRYTDYALQQFFNTVSKTAWFKNTLFVITADHTSQAAIPYYKTTSGMFRIPILFYQPESKLKGMKEDIVQQIDIMPSVLDYLDIETSYIAFGSSIFDTLAKRFAIHYFTETYQLIKDNHILLFDGEKTVGFYNHKLDPLHEKSSLWGEEPRKRKNMETFLKAFIQQYNSRMISNDMIFKQGG